MRSCKDFLSGVFGAKPLISLLRYVDVPRDRNAGEDQHNYDDAHTCYDALNLHIHPLVPKRSNAIVSGLPRTEEK